MQGCVRSSLGAEDREGVCVIDPHDLEVRGTAEGGISVTSAVKPRLPGSRDEGDDVRRLEAVSEAVDLEDVRELVVRQIELVIRSEG